MTEIKKKENDYERIEGRATIRGRNGNREFPQKDKEREKIKFNKIREGRKKGKIQ